MGFKGIGVLGVWGLRFSVWGLGFTISRSKVQGVSGFQVGGYSPDTAQLIQALGFRV